MADKLIVACKSCGRDIDTQLSVARDAFEAEPFADREYACPQCNETNTYTKDDHVFAG